ncbi:MAG: drug/metabolite transporter, family [Actinomycetota bacterium]|nr:drug/metabolite transporter, family [Actinomycetota bacterium]
MPAVNHRTTENVRLPQVHWRSDFDQEMEIRPGPTRHQTLGPLLVAMASAIWGTIGIATSFLPDGTSPQSIAGTRMAIGGSVLLALFARPSTVRPLVCVPRVLIWVILAVISMALYQASFFTAIANTGMAIASVVTMGCIPLFAGLLSRLAGLRLARRWVASTTGAVGGCALLTLHGAETGRHVLSGIGCAIMAGGFYSVFTVASARLIRTGACPRTTMAVTLAGAAVLMSPFVVAGSSRWLLTPSGITVAFYLGLVATVGAYSLYGAALRTVSVPVVSTLVLAEPAAAAMLAVALLGEDFDALTSTGFALISLALLATAIPTPRCVRHQAGLICP